MSCALPRRNGLFGRFDGKSNVPMYPSGHDNQGVAAVILCLEEWLLALEDGTAIHRLPELEYPKTWTEEQLAELMRSIDKEIDQEVARTPGTTVGAKAGPEFVRLEPLQRLALAQQLHQLCEQYKDVLGPTDEVSLAQG